jgi:hypothetical protein
VKRHCGVFIGAPRTSSHTDQTEAPPRAGEVMMGRGDEIRALFVLLAMAAVLYLVVWLVEPLGEEEELPEPVPAEGFMPARS